MPLCVILQNENKVDGMCAIMDEHTSMLLIYLNIMEVQKKIDLIMCMLAGGDQVNVVRAHMVIMYKNASYQHRKFERNCPCSGRLACIIDTVHINFDKLEIIMYTITGYICSINEAEFRKATGNINALKNN